MILGSHMVEEIETRASYITCSAASNISNNDENQLLQDCNATRGSWAGSLISHLSMRCGCKVTFSSTHSLSPGRQGTSRSPGRVFPQVTIYGLSKNVQVADMFSSHWAASDSDCSVLTVGVATPVGHNL